MARGGRRTPDDQTPVVAGPGRFARRTDGRAPIDVPNVGDSEELRHGDRQRLEAAQRVASVPRAASPRVQAPAPNPGSPTSSGGGGAALPPHLFGGETTRPEEPITEGLPFGPGSGPGVLTLPEPEDDMEVFLQAMVELTGDQASYDMLTEHRDFKQWRTERQGAPALAAVEPEPTIETSSLAGEEVVEAQEDTVALPDDLAAEEEVAVEGDEEELSVETPEAAIPEEGGEPSAPSPTPEDV